MQGTDAPPAAESQVESGGRGWVKGHPGADMFPIMADDELDALGKDIFENGLQQRITLWTPSKSAEAGRQKADEHLLGWAKRKGFELFLLDGRNRLAATERVD